MASGRTLAVIAGSRLDRSKPYWRNQEMGWWSEDDPSGSLMDTRECYGPSLQLKELGWKKVGRTRTLAAPIFTLDAHWRIEWKR